MDRKEEILGYLRRKLSAINKTLSRNDKEYLRLMSEKLEVMKAIEDLEKEIGLEN